MKVLVVGGTADGRHLATQLYHLGFDVRYSIAGVVRKATLPCPVITGGFTQFGGLQQYLVDQKITHIVDATDPFAQKMSNKIAQVCEALSLAAIRFQQPQWRATSADLWIDVNDWSQVIAAVAKYDRLLVSAGQVSQSVLDQLAVSSKQLFLRTAMPVKINLPNNVSWLKAVGPFQLANEIALLEEHNIDAVISKNNGGHSTYAKIQAAASLSLPVFQFERPKLLAIDNQFDTLAECVELLSQWRNTYYAG
ncbi:precorrin-6A reductase [Psychromonas marina]|uniref:Precorrin-6A reductase n=1 Tax=Psychromonas marina TaxID=88364 RepID=A0ABQ6E1V4_9GAMM|nr:precorrin-6A/cobalt-precorrin-6A reductase [Psychromonas marina]GLS91383.1 precorrin-6A reductase [Psychromonas marina]